MGQIKVLHILPKITSGGGSHSPLNVVSNSNKKEDFNHIFLSLEKGTDDILDKFISKGFEVIDNPTEEHLYEEIERADIVQIEWWNSPITCNFLSKKLPANRLLVWSHVTGNIPPHIITPQLIQGSDHLCVCTPHSLEIPYLKNRENISFIHSPADFNRLTGFQKRKHKGFSIGYIGTIDYSKLPKKFISLCDKISIPNAHFIVCGNGRSLADIKKLASASTHTFEFPGHVGNIKDYLEQMDVYGYPLNKKTFAAAEQNLQEAMWVGLPIVTNPYGGVQHLIKHNKTGLLVESNQDYISVIEYLHKHPEERERLGKNAAAHARKHFTPEISADKFENLYKRMMKSPKTSKEPIYRLSAESHSIGAKLLIESIEDFGKALRLSMKNTLDSDVLRADQEIAKSEDLFHQGCIVQFLHAYPTDPWLNFWNGLIEYERQNFPDAHDYWSLAIRYGIKCDRAFYYLANVADFEEQEELRNKLLRLRNIYDEKISVKQSNSSSSPWENLSNICASNTAKDGIEDLRQRVKRNPRIISPELCLSEQIKHALEKTGKRPVFLWGAGVTGQKVKKAMDLLKEFPQGFIDRSEKIDDQVLGLPVFSPEILEGGESAFVLICTMHYRQVSESLEKLGLKPTKDFLALHVP